VGRGGGGHGGGVVHVAKLCLDIPDPLYEWLTSPLRVGELMVADGHKLKHV
jgi:hypothetical protein